METKTKFEKLLKKLSHVSKLTEDEILHIHTQTTAEIYRLLTKDLDALDIAIYKNGEIRIYKMNKPVRISKEVEKVIIEAIYRSIDTAKGFKQLLELSRYNFAVAAKSRRETENKVFLNNRIN